MTKSRKIIYWISTLWLSLGMVSSAVVQLMRVPDAVENVTHLGYPSYLLTVLGIWKILGVLAILAPGFPTLKEWAYAGFFFTASGAAISHICMGDAIGEIFPSLLLLTLTVISRYLRPAERRSIPANH
jgi:hypothetical protein